MGDVIFLPLFIFFYSSAAVDFLIATVSKAFS